MTIHLQIITPEKIVYKDDVDEILAPTVNGEIGILPNHVPLLTKIMPGELRVKKGSNEQYLAVTGGFLEVAKNNATILADYAIRSEHIDELKAEEAKKRAEKVMSEKVSERDFAIAQSDLRKSLLELHVANRRKKRRV